MTNYQIMLLINVFLLGFMLLSLYFTVRFRKLSRQAEIDLGGARKERDDALSQNKDLREELDTLKKQSDHETAKEEAYRIQTEMKKTYENAQVQADHYRKQAIDTQTELEKTRKERDDALRQTEVSREDARQSQIKFDGACKELEGEKDQVEHYKDQCRFIKEAYEDCQKETENALRRLKNCREQIEEERKEELKGFAKKIIPVLDKMERDLDDLHLDGGSLAISPSAVSDHSSIIKNMALYLKEFEQVMERSGFQVFYPKGRPIDFKTSRIIGDERREGVDSGIVLSVYRKGWLFGGKIVRFADVVIAK
ncbi:nucleotide exchange factor GrpE [Thioalkalivibrio sp. HK1]|uniref:nucleotide exchange factor GrpE n=1 Tax=Thioalkalivibrio sp. HK1 TaxID=1469245 RepID=UPI0018CC016D|nr:nucleotide exchange factor GrpE [Thioalkalivibrio sp. HK1]